MEKTNDRRIGRLTISILAAIVMWIYVDVERAPNVISTYRGIPVEFSGEDTALADKNLMLMEGYDTFVDLKLEAPRRELRKLDRNNIRLIVDTSGITSTGVQTLRWNIYYPDTVSGSAVKVVDASAYNVTVTVGELFTKEIPVYCDVTGDVPEGYLLGTLHTDPEVLILHAQREDLLDVSYAKVTVDVEDAKHTVVKSMNAALYDYDDHPVDPEHIRISNGLVQVTQPVYTTKEVPLKINFTGAAGSIGDSVQCSIYPASVTLMGEETALAGIDNIILENIDVQKLAASQKKNYSIRAPEGVFLLGEDTIATATITVTGTTEKQVLVQDIACTNLAEGLEASVTGGLYVTLWGSTEDVDEVSAEDVTVSADLSGVTEPGTYSVTVLVKVQGYRNVTAKGTYQVSVNVMQSAPPSPVEEEIAPEVPDGPAD